MEALRSSAESSLNALMKNKPQDLESNLRMSELVLQRARDFEQFSLELSLLGNEAKAQELHLQSLKLFERGLDNSETYFLGVAKHHSGIFT